MKILAPYFIFCLAIVFVNCFNNDSRLSSYHGEKPFLLVAETHDVWVISQVTGELTSVAHDLDMVIDVDYDYEKQKLFFNDDDYIYASDITVSGDNFTTSKQQKILDNIGSVEGMAYDWVHEVLYFTDNGKNTIELFTMMREHKTIFDTNLDEPRGIAVDPRDDQKWIYWADWGIKPKIEKSGLDGSNRALLVVTGLGWPNHLTIDYSENRLYWVDCKLDWIMSSGLDGQNVLIVFKSPRYSAHPFSIDVLGDAVFWSDWQTNKVYQTSKKTPSAMTDLTKSEFAHSPMGVAVFHQSRQPNGTDHCKVNNARCSHICLVAPALGTNEKKFNCFCPDGMSLKKDGLNCQ